MTDKKEIKKEEKLEKLLVCKSDEIIESLETVGESIKINKPFSRFLIPVKYHRYRPAPVYLDGGYEVK